MLKITLQDQLLYNEEEEKFVQQGPTFLLEHSLLSVSKWEEKYEKPFFNPDKEKTQEEVFDYISMMVVEPKEIPPDFITKLTKENLKEIEEHIAAKKTATWFSKSASNKPSKEVQTSELIYYYMFSAGIPKECETWHLNRLLTLIRIFGEKNQQPKKMSQSEIIARNRHLNAQRKAQLNTRG